VKGAKYPVDACLARAEGLAEERVREGPEIHLLPMLLNVANFLMVTQGLLCAGESCLRITDLLMPRVLRRQMLGVPSKYSKIVSRCAEFLSLFSNLQESYRFSKK
jgi:hypothetical protein